MKIPLAALALWVVAVSPVWSADPPRVNARQLVNEYHADNNAAIAKYARKPVQIDGVFEGTTQSSADTQFLRLSGESDKRTLPIDCMLKGEDAKTNYPFKKGDPVSIVGTWDGSLFLGSYISIFPCKVLTSGLTGASAAAGLGPKPITVIPPGNYNCSGLAVRLNLDIGIKGDYAIAGKGDGQYRYDAKSGAVTWLSGPLKGGEGRVELHQDSQTYHLKIVQPAHVNEKPAIKHRLTASCVLPGK
jgi:hypothetical protein